jgi:hypothetical protein
MGVQTTAVIPHELLCLLIPITTPFPLGIFLFPLLQLLKKSLFDLVSFPWGYRPREISYQINSMMVSVI